MRATYSSSGERLLYPITLKLSRKQHTKVAHPIVFTFCIDWLYRYARKLHTNVQQSASHGFALKVYVSGTVLWKSVACASLNLWCFAVCFCYCLGVSGVISVSLWHFGPCLYYSRAFWYVSLLLWGILAHVFVILGRFRTCLCYSKAFWPMYI